MSWDDVVRTLKSRGYRYYNASTGPIEIDWWSGPHGGKNGSGLAGRFLSQTMLPWWSSTQR